MFNLKFTNKLCPFPESAHPGDFHLKKQLQWVFFLRVVVLSILLGISMLLQTRDHDIIIPPQRYIAYFIAGTYLFTIFSALLLNVIPCYRRFALVQITIDCLLASCLVLFTGSSQSIFVIIYYFPIISSAILFLRKGTLFLAALSTFTFGSIIFAEFSGKINFLLQNNESPLTNIQMALHQFAIPGTTFFIVALLSSVLSERLHLAELKLTKTSLDLDRLALLYKQIFDDISTGIITVNTIGNITSFNRSAGIITGYQALDVLGKNIKKMFPELTTDKDDVMRPMTNLRKKNGTKIPVGYSWGRLNMPGDCENCRVFTMQDLSKIKRMEEQIHQAEKMAAIGEMAAGIAHEFRNPLAAISGASQVLESEFQPNTPSHSLMTIIVRECDRLEGTISDFLHYSKPATPEKNWFSLLGVVEETVEILRQNRTWNERFTVETNIPENLDCWADVHQVKQILLNLMENAHNAIDEGHGIITVTASEINEYGTDETLLTITDNGPGIKEKDIKHLFEPFFTTRENGTGLGLAIVRQLVESQGGKIWLNTNKNSEGASFSFTLPLP